MRDYYSQTNLRTDEALNAFNNIMAMETISLLDDEKQSSARTELTLPEIYKTRLLRLDLGARSRTDPIQRWIHQYLRYFRYWRLSRPRGSLEGLESFKSSYRWSYQNSLLIATVLGRIITVVMIGVFIVIPLAILSTDRPRGTQLIIVSVFILVFVSLMAVMLNVSNSQMMAVAAAYAAVLSVFNSNGSGDIGLV